MTKKERLEEEAKMFEAKARFIANKLIYINHAMNSKLPDVDIDKVTSEVNTIIDFAFDTDRMETQIYTNTGLYNWSDDTRYTSIRYRYESKVDGRFLWDRVNFTEDEING